MSQTTPVDNTNRPFLERAYKLSNTDIEGTRQFYDEWAATYDSDLADPSHDWVAPSLSAKALLEYFQHTPTSNSAIEILDAGCGTGIVGVALAKQASQNVKFKIDGIDLSQGMLDIARKTGVYGSLEIADMSGPLAVQTGSYDAVICVGVLTQGHVGPGVLFELARVLKPGGCIVATVREDIWESGGYKKEIERLESDGMIEIVSAKSENSLKGANITMKVPVLKRL